ncbi:MAG: tRNA (N6-isopentenyl adenosine(37)-C2)-methylthiotransferase MiaB [Eubacterium sp.]|nr:tRNA (N6-isopentenyl adenosine(37)-C2)-methylthiotransferase MiaB [Eubacterium sp.]
MTRQENRNAIRIHLKKLEEKKGRPLTAACITFGCQMNARDSEKLRGMLSEAGFQITEEEDADLVLYNTCTVRENANLKVYGRLGYMHSLKKKDPDKIIGLCGCMMQEPSVIETLRREYPFVNMIFGTHNLHRLPFLLEKVLECPEEQFISVLPDTDEIVEDLPKIRKYPFKSGVNIMFGCNNFCSYCIVPYVRGREKSRKPEDILAEIRQLAQDGVKEIMLLGQNVNSYGKTLDMPVTFAALLEQVVKTDGIERIRFMTSHPKDLSDELIRVMADNPKICRHLHLPLQSGSTAVLDKMNRRYTKEQYLELVSRIRAAIPDISLTTDIIVGFPGETEADFQETLDVVRRVRYDSAFTFIYSKRTGTPAASMDDQVPEDVVHDRFDRLLSLVQQIGREETSRFEGQIRTVLVENVNPQDPGLVSGRLESNTVVHFPGNASLIGSIIPVRLAECRGFYYMGDVV